MTRTPIALGPRVYKGPMTVAAIATWLEGYIDDQARIFRTNMVLAVDAGELRADQLEDVLAIASEETRTVKASIRSQVLRCLSDRREGARQ